MAVEIQIVLARNLKAFRKKKNWSQEDAADACKISERHYQRFEEKTRWPSPEFIRKLAKGFRCKQWELFEP